MWLDRLRGLFGRRAEKATVHDDVTPPLFLDRSVARQRAKDELALERARLGLGTLEPELKGDGPVPKEWLQSKVTLEEAEAGPLRGAGLKWDAMKAALLPDDEIWVFASDRESWQHLAGRAGIAIVRDGVVVTTMVTMMN